MKIDIPTALTVHETVALQHLAEDRNCIEIGSLLGYSTVAMAKTARKVVAVDPHDGYPYWQPRPTLDPFLHNIRRHGVSERVIPAIGQAKDILPGLDQADFCFIDVTGFYEDTLNCLDLAKARCPVIACHDYARGDCHGTTKAVDEFARRHGFEIQTIDTLAVLEKPV